MADSCSTCLTFLLLCASVPLGAASLASEEYCTYDCDAPCNNPWYIHTLDGRCGSRSAMESSFFAVSSRCLFNDQILDERSCMSVIPETKGDQKMIGNVTGSSMSFTANFNSTTGCTINAQVSGLFTTWFALDQFQTVVCFGDFREDVATWSQGIAIAVGLILGVVSTVYKRRSSSFIDKLVEKYGTGVLFAPGSKVVAMHTTVGWFSQTGVRFYRICQVIANVWLPAALMWIVTPYIIAPLWFLLYFIPPFMVVGVELLSQPRHVLTPPLVSLHGIGNHQRDGTRDYLFSMLRPLILIAATLGIVAAIVKGGGAHGASVVEQGALVVNQVAFWRFGLQEYWGHMVLSFGIAVTIVGTLLHVALTILPVAKACFCLGSYGLIRFSANETLRQEVQELSDKVCRAAHADEEKDEDRVAALKVDTWSKMDVLVALGLACADFGAYLFKIYVFLRDGRYPLAAMMTIALVEAITTLIGNGHVWNAPTAIRRAMVSGVPGVHFLAMTQWDDSLAGIPSLFLTVYALPMTRIDSPLTCASSILFLCTGTRALAVYLQDVTDSDMYSLPADWLLHSKELDELSAAEEEKPKGVFSWLTCCSSNSSSKDEKRTLMKGGPELIVA